MNSLFAALRLALADERGPLIVALYEMPTDDLERLVEAAQLIDSEGVEALELRDHAASDQSVGRAVEVIGELLDKDPRA